MDKSQKRLIVRVENKVRRAVERDMLWAPGATVVTAISGGADSLCLLGALDALRMRAILSAPGRIVLAHLDHGLRGAAGAADAAFVAEMARGLGLECVTGREDVAALARREKRSLEDAARRARYAFLRRVAANVGAECVVTGHTRDDQAETVLMHFIRGAGLAGLGGMAPRGGDIARPLLDLTRAETEAYCAARGWVPREDVSNVDLGFFRNRVRHALLPFLERENPHLRETLARNASLIAADAAYLDALARDAWERAVRSATADAITFDLQTLRALPGPLRSRLLREAQRRMSGEEEEGLEARHIEAAEEYVRRGPNGTWSHLPGGLRLVRGPDTLAVTHAPAADAGQRPRQPTMEPVTLPVPGERALLPLGVRLRARVLDASAVRPEMLRGGVRHVAYADADAAGEPLRVRTWRPGDRFQPLGMAGEKKLQDYFTDAHIPRDERARVPLVCGPAHLVWVAGHRLDERVRVTPQTRRVLELTLADGTEP
jgi:tRNA(Ile)-lysidine synthase